MFAPCLGKRQALGSCKILVKYTRSRGIISMRSGWQQTQRCLESSARLAGVGAGSSDLVLDVL